MFKINGVLLEEKGGMYDPSLNFKMRCFTYWVERHVPVGILTISFALFLVTVALFNSSLFCLSPFQLLCGTVSRSCKLINGRSRPSDQEGWQSSRPWDMGGGGGGALQKIFLWPQFRIKIRGTGVGVGLLGPSPKSATAFCWNFTLTGP